jgi:AraC family transcriptional regulator, arabinose operon regulatory protein
MRRNLEPIVPAYDELLTGHFREGRSYRTVRQSGTVDWLLILTVGGSGRFSYGGSGDTIVGPGEIVLIRPGARHDYGVAPGSNTWELLWAHFLPRPHWLPWLRWPEPAPGVMHLNLADPAIRDRVLARFAEADELTRSALSGRELFAMNAIEEVLLWCRSLCDDPGEAESDPRVDSVRQFIRQRLGEAISMPDLAAHSGLSASRLTQLFRQHTGATPMRHLEALRMERARNLLARTSQSVGRIAEEVGFENPFYFTLRFKRATGMSPTEFRDRSAQGFDE